MSRFLVSKNSIAFDTVANHYDVHFEREKNGCFLDCIFSTWYKSAIKESSFSLREQGSAFYSGTLGYAGKVGLDALNNIYDDFHEGEFSELLKRTSGCFAVVINKFDKLYFFVDPLATFKAYYLDSEVAISNNFYGLARAYSDRLDINKAALIEQSFQYSIIGSETMLKGISKLQSGELYVYRSGGDFKVYRNNIFGGKSSVSGSVSQDLTSLAEKVAEGYGSISINMTGGLDSRLVLSSFLAARSVPTLVYGKGNSSATNTKLSDENIVEKLSSEFNLENLKMDWSLPDYFIKDWGFLLSKYGEYYTVYCGNRNLIEQYETFVSSFSRYTCFGYFGETFRNVDRLESSARDVFNVNGLLEDIYLYHGPNYEFLGDFKDEYRDNVANKIGLICDFEGLDRDGFSRDEFQVIHNRYRSEADSKMSGFVNSIMFSSVFLSDYGVQYKVRSVPSAKKSAAHYQLGIIYDLLPSALKVPLFSHGQRYDIDNNELVMDRQVLMTSWSSAIKRVPIIGSTAKKLKAFLRKVPDSSLSAQYLGCYSRAWLNDRVIELQDVLGVSIVKPELFRGDVRALVYYIMYLYLLANVFGKTYSFPPVEDKL